MTGFGPRHSSEAAARSRFGAVPRRPRRPNHPSLYCPNPGHRLLRSHGLALPSGAGGRILIRSESALSTASRAIARLQSEVRVDSRNAVTASDTASARYSAHPGGLHCSMKLRSDCSGMPIREQKAPCPARSCCRPARTARRRARAPRGGSRRHSLPTNARSPGPMGPRHHPMARDSIATAQRRSTRQAASAARTGGPEARPRPPRRRSTRSGNTENDEWDDGRSMSVPPPEESGTARPVENAHLALHRDAPKRFAPCPDRPGRNSSGNARCEG